MPSGPFRVFPQAGGGNRFIRYEDYKMKIDRAAMREVILQAIGKDTVKPKLKKVTVFNGSMEMDLRAAIVAWTFKLLKERNTTTGIVTVGDFAETFDHTLREETRDIDISLSQMVRGLIKSQQ